MAEEHEDEPTTWWRPEPPCRCDVARGECRCWDDETTGEPREFEGRVPETITAPTGAAAGRAGER